MHRTSSRLSVLAGAILAACASEGEIGSEQCVEGEPDCEVPIAVNYIAPPSFDEVSTDDAREAHVTHTIPWAGCDDNDICRAALVADGAGGVWARLSGPFTGTAPPLRFTHHDAEGMLLAEGDVGGEDEDGALTQSYGNTPFSLPEGGIAFGAISRIGSLERPSSYSLELARIDDDGSELLQVGHSKPVGGSGMPKTRFDISPHALGFVATFSSSDERLVRLLDHDGTQLWQRAVPRNATDHFRVISLPAGFALQTLGRFPDAGSQTLTSGLLWYDQDGSVVRHVFLSQLVQWPLAVGLSDGRVALASLVTLSEEGQRYASSSDLYVMRVASNGTLSGHRVRNESAVEPRELALARDDADTLYVSTIGGQRSLPHGLVCVLPAQGEPACYALPDGIVLHALAPVGGDVIYGSSESALYRIELTSER